MLKQFIQMPLHYIAFYIIIITTMIIIDIFKKLITKKITPQEAAKELNWPLELVIAALKSPLVVKDFNDE